MKNSSVVNVSGSSGAGRSGGVMYKVATNMRTTNYFTEIPCGICPLIHMCVDGGIVSPSTCEYMTQWLAIPDKELF